MSLRQYAHERNERFSAVTRGMLARIALAWTMTACVIAAASLYASLYGH